MASQRSLIAPIRRLMTPRPAIQAWRNSRCFATEIQSSNQPVTPPIMSSQAPPSSSAPVTAPISGSDSSISPLGESNVPASFGQEEDGVMEAKTEKKERRPVGVVVSSGKMDKTVKVRVPDQRWDRYLRKHFRSHTSHLVHDPSTSLVTGDVISLRPFRAAKQVHHIVHSLLVPFGQPISSRPRIPTEEEMTATYTVWKAKKVERRDLRARASKGEGEAIAKLKEMGLEIKVGQAKKKSARQGQGSRGQRTPERVARGSIDERGKRNAEVTAKKERVAQRNMETARRRSEELGTREGVFGEETEEIRTEGVVGGRMGPRAGSVKQD